MCGANSKMLPLRGLHAKGVFNEGIDRVGRAASAQIPWRCRRQLNFHPSVRRMESDRVYQMRSLVFAMILSLVALTGADSDTDVPWRVGVARQSEILALEEAVHGYTDINITK